MSDGNEPLVVPNRIAHLGRRCAKGAFFFSVSSNCCFWTLIR
jgi:hypothetical protein